MKKSMRHILLTSLSLFFLCSCKEKYALEVNQVHISEYENYIQIKNNSGANLEIFNFELNHAFDLEYLAHSDKIVNKYINAILVVGIDDQGNAYLVCGFKDSPPPQKYKNIILSPDKIYEIKAPMENFYRCYGKEINKFQVLLVRTKIVKGENKLNEKNKYQILFASKFYEMQKWNGGH